MSFVFIFNKLNIGPKETWQLWGYFLVCAVTEVPYNTVLNVLGFFFWLKTIDSSSKTILGSFYLYM